MKRLTIIHSSSSCCCCLSTAINSIGRFALRHRSFPCSSSSLHCTMRCYLIRACAHCLGCSSAPPSTAEDEESHPHADAVDMIGGSEIINGAGASRIIGTSAVGGRRSRRPKPPPISEGRGVRTNYASD
ncbi:uncharacterized protein LOC122038884 [Zingiber officinale]|uniref:uncharacterized protein LOC122038884 n=1 Tax=Zingiber officinale TaxID=94328 RepID=UPI001C4C48C9|nr:uncharacterized protein LOC122038884 [Zingiber officinale]